MLDTEFCDDVDFLFEDASDSVSQGAKSDIKLIESVYNELIHSYLARSIQVRRSNLNLADVLSKFEQGNNEEKKRIESHLLQAGLLTYLVVEYDFRADRLGMLKDMLNKVFSGPSTDASHQVALSYLYNIVRHEDKQFMTIVSVINILVMGDGSKNISNPLDDLRVIAQRLKNRFVA